MHSRTFCMLTVLLALPWIASGQNKPDQTKQTHASVPAHIWIAGAVTHPGAYVFAPHMRVADALKLAGPTQDADLAHVRVIKHAKTSTDISVFDATPSAAPATPSQGQIFELQPDESVFVPFTDACTVG